MSVGIESWHVDDLRLHRVVRTRKPPTIQLAKPIPATFEAHFDLRNSQRDRSSAWTEVMHATASQYVLSFSLMVICTLLEMF
jgi:hypothetical protein